MPFFIKSTVNPSEWINDQKNEICFIGRSNVGKSTLINALAKEKIALVSKTPGRTQTVNFYDFGQYRLVDLPGYGFMIGSHKLKNQVTSIIDTYLTTRTNLYGVIQICDANVITELDTSMSKYFQQRFKHHYVVLNKIDKRQLHFYQNKIQQIAKYLKISPDKIYFVSAKNKINIDQIHKLINTINQNF
ncbi:MAG: ribosome biogenesis GTP-binding protein YihA/YsxC [Mycoplasmataceae bacterium]|nr:ribosome biogenesis GTP-binding protein YihA/YsxC [Mycoplasmataceae bacterium]